MRSLYNVVPMACARIRLVCADDRFGYTIFSGLCTTPKTFRYVKVVQQGKFLNFKRGEAKPNEAARPQTFKEDDR